MKRDEIAHRITLADFKGSTLLDLCEALMKEEVPNYKFALREDLKDDVRFLPTRAEPLATGYDVCAAPEDRKDIILRAGQYFNIPLGFRCLPPQGWWYALHPRSSSFVKRYMHNLIGIIDESWEGYTSFTGQYIPDINSISNDLIIKFRQPIAQIIPTKRQDMTLTLLPNKELDDLYDGRNASRKSGGFGSTG